MLGYPPRGAWRLTARPADPQGLGQPRGGGGGPTAPKTVAHPSGSHIGWRRPPCRLCPGQASAHDARPHDRKACALASPPRGGPGECGAPRQALPAGATREPIRLSPGKERKAQSPKPPKVTGRYQVQSLSQLE